ncbi:MAG: formate dehydrogenase subunit gamma [Kiloniellaceae bacterium]
MPWNPDLVQEIADAHKHEDGALLPILHALNDRFGYVDARAVPLIADVLNLSRAEVHGVVSFYHDFREAPAGKVVVKVCRAEACQSMGAMGLIEQLCGRHGVSLGDTSAAGVTIEPVYCLGNCACAPAAMVNDRLHGRLDAERLDSIIAEAQS